MSGLLKSRDYLMKCLGFILLFGFISLGTIGGCNNNGGGQDGTRALTENDFAEDQGLLANPSGGVVVTFVEPPDSEKPDNDTGEVGNDIIPYRYNEDLNHTYCFEDEDVDAEHFAILFDTDSNEVLRVEANGECVTELIPAGDYFLEITHDGKIDETLPLFAIADHTHLQAAQRGDTDQGLLKSVKTQFSNILSNFHNIIAQKAKAQSVAQNVSTLLSSKECVSCDLIGAKLSDVDLSDVDLSNTDLRNADLTGADLTGADLTGAKLNFADLTGAKLNFTNLSDADLSDANLTQADLTLAVLTGADLGDAVLTGATLEADLRNADLTGANLTGANLTGVALGSTTFDFAIWCDGICTCAQNSTDTCVGCASIDTCDGT